MISQTAVHCNKSVAIGVTLYCGTCNIGLTQKEYESAALFKILRKKRIKIGFLRAIPVSSGLAGILFAVCPHKSAFWHSSCLLLINKTKGREICMKHAKTVIPICGAALSAFWLIYGLSRHGFWHNPKGPLPGFVPSLAAAFMLAVSIMEIVHSIRQDEKSDQEPEIRNFGNWFIVFAAMGIFALVFLTGMIPALLLFVFCWLQFYEKVPLKNTILLLVVSFAIVFGVFTLWLGVPFPKGLIVNVISG
jgi:hypothetical protein